MSNDKLEDFIRNQADDFNDEELPTDLWPVIEAQIISERSREDPLEGFIRKNRDAFDDATPPPRLFESIVPASRLRVAGISRYLAIAAAVVLVFGLSYTIGNRAGYQSGQLDAVTAEMNRISPDAVETEQFYQREIETHFRRVTQLNDDPQLRADLREIDRATAELRSDLLDVPIQQRPDLVSQLIENYQIKLDILLRIEEQLSPRPTSEQGRKATNHDNL